MAAFRWVRRLPTWGTTTSLLLGTGAIHSCAKSEPQRVPLPHEITATELGQLGPRSTRASTAGPQLADTGGADVELAFPSGSPDINVPAFVRDVFMLYSGKTRDDDDVGRAVSRLYSPNATFEDPLVYMQNRKEIAAAFMALRGAGEVNVDSAQVQLKELSPEEMELYHAPTNRAVVIVLQVAYQHRFAQEPSVVPIAMRLYVEPPASSVDGSAHPHGVVIRHHDDLWHGKQAPNGPGGVLHSMRFLNGKVVHGAVWALNGGSIPGT